MTLSLLGHRHEVKHINKQINTGLGLGGGMDAFFIAASISE